MRNARGISSAHSPVPRRPGVSVEGGVTKCSADLALRMIQLGATIVHVSETLDEAKAEALARAMALSTTLVEFTATGSDDSFASSFADLLAANRTLAICAISGA